MQRHLLAGFQMGAFAEQDRHNRLRCRVKGRGLGLRLRRWAGPGPLQRPVVRKEKALCLNSVQRALRHLAAGFHIGVNQGLQHGFYTVGHFLLLFRGQLGKHTVLRWLLGGLLCLCIQVFHLIRRQLPGLQAAHQRPALFFAAAIEDVAQLCHAVFLRHIGLQQIAFPAVFMVWIGPYLINRFRDKLCRRFFGLRLFLCRGLFLLGLPLLLKLGKVAVNGDNQLMGGGPDGFQRGFQLF